jgi:hypothetical protein
MAFGFDGGGGAAITSIFMSPGGGWSEYTTRPLASVHLYNAPHAGAVAANVPSTRASANGATGIRARPGLPGVAHWRQLLLGERFIVRLR